MVVMRYLALLYHRVRPTNGLETSTACSTGILRALPSQSRDPSKDVLGEQDISRLN